MKVATLLNSLVSQPDQANALAAFGSLAVGLLALFVAGLSIYYTVRGLALQQRHNELSVLPVPFIALADYENLLRVKIRNDGLGPLIVKGLKFHNKNQNGEFSDLVSYMPTLPSSLSWSNFSSGYIRSIRPGDELILLELQEDSFSLDFAAFRDACRQRLKFMQVELDYTDVYGLQFVAATRDLEWSGRRLASSRATNQ